MSLAQIALPLNMWSHGSKRPLPCNVQHCFSTSPDSSSVDVRGPCLSKNYSVGTCALFRKGKRRSTHMTKCSSSETANADHVESNGLVELPLFPLPLVLFPGAILPLQIFEFRYRMMMHTLLQTDLRFGVIYTDQLSGIVEVGCVGEVVKHERLVDDRFFLICKGQERFRVVKLVRTKPYLVAQVQWLEDRPSDDGQEDDLEKLASEVETYMKDVIRIFPTPFSFFVGSTFEGAPAEQQALLELEDTAARLKREKETLRNTLNYLTAAAAVKDVFPSSD